MPLQLTPDSCDTCCADADETATPAAIAALSLRPNILSMPLPVNEIERAEQVSFGPASIEKAAEKASRAIPRTATAMMAVVMMPFIASVPRGTLSVARRGRRVTGR